MSHTRAHSRALNDQYGKRTFNVEEVNHEGLGRLPYFLPSVSSMLLFNSSENPYKNYNSIDNLVGWFLAKEKITDETKATILADAPLTLGLSIDFDVNDPIAQMMYRPQAAGEMVPGFTLPALQLSNVAEDINFLIDQVSIISFCLSNEKLSSITFVPF